MAFAAFFVTRVIAANNRATTLNDATRWYQRGQQQLAAGEVADAIDSYRRARLRNRGEKTYALALARALAVHGDTAGAQNALVALRQSWPEDAVVNLELARLAVARKDVLEAVRFYQNALYAPWPTEQADRRRQIRMEMVDFLLAQNEAARAIPELIALGMDMRDLPQTHLELAYRFAKAGDQARALDQFERALRRDPDNTTALAGAGRAAFALGNYVRAARYLRTAPPDSSALKELQEVINWVLYADPLAPRIAFATRARRLQDNFTFAERRLQSCLQKRAGVPHGNDEAALQAEAKQLRRRLRLPGARSDATLDAGVNLIYRIERAVVQNCPPATARDRALILIGERHGAEQG